MPETIYMASIKITLDKFYVIGIAVETTNQNAKSQQDIGKLWERFFSENIISRIPGKISDDIYCIYTDYVNKAEGNYTTILGCKVSVLNNIPEGLTGKTIPASTYLLYKSVGKLPDCVITTWKTLWQSPIERSYLSDFDVYGQKSQEANNAEVETYVSILS
jgi:predicted transcriptional regulator YdeE